MQKQWEKLEAWLAEQAPSVLADLNGPADAALLADLQSTLQVALPGQFMACLQIHNGQKTQAECLFDEYAFLSVRRILMSWSTWNELLDGGDFKGREARAVGPVQPVWWSKKWVPFASNGRGDYLCLDMDPAPQGTTGQLISVFHDCADRSVIAAQFGPWFDSFVEHKSH